MENYFDAEKVMGMSREEAISLLGKNASVVREGLKNGTLTYNEFERICEESFPIQQQARLVRNVIFTQLSQTEGFNMFESNKEKQAEYSNMVRLREKAENGELTRDELKQLCNKVFGEDSAMSRKIQDDFVKSGRIKQSEPRKDSKQFSGRQEKKIWDLEPEEKSRIQKETAETAKMYNSKQDRQTQAMQQEIQGQSNNMQSQIPVQQPAVNMGGMEL